MWKIACCPLVHKWSVLLLIPVQDEVDDIVYFATPTDRKDAACIGVSETGIIESKNKELAVIMSHSVKICDNIQGGIQITMKLREGSTQQQHCVER